MSWMALFSLDFSFSPRFVFPIPISIYHTYLSQYLNTRLWHHFSDTELPMPPSPVMQIPLPPSSIPGRGQGACWSLSRRVRGYCIGVRGSGRACVFVQQFRYVTHFYLSNIHPDIRSIDNIEATSGCVTSISSPANYLSRRRACAALGMVYYCPPVVRRDSPPTRFAGGGSIFCKSWIMSFIG
jgi:hypothetical protein